MVPVRFPVFAAILFTLLLGGVPAIARADDSATTPVLADKSAVAELAFWNSIKNSSNAADYQTYLENFPNGMFYDQALAGFQQAGGKPSELSVLPPPKGATDITTSGSGATTAETTVTLPTTPKTVVVKKRNAVVKNNKKKKTTSTVVATRKFHPPKSACRSGHAQNGICITKTKLAQRPNASTYGQGGGGGGGGSSGGGGGGSSGGGSWGH